MGHIWMKRFFPALTLVLVLVPIQTLAWSNHSYPTYRALEKMSEVANAAPVTVEPLETFLRDEEYTIEALLASQEAWAVANLENFPVRPTALAFIANPERNDEARRLAFLTALRVAPNTKFALFVQPDALGGPMAGAPLACSLVSTLPEPQNSGHKFMGVKPGDQIAALAVIASAADEPDYGLDINLWQDSPSEWGKQYGFGSLPFGNPSLNSATQAPFHMGFFHEERVLYAAAPYLKRTFPLMRSYQFGSLAELAFRTGHAYWGWRFAGMSLHYLQDLTQPYHASLAPGESTLKLLGINALAMAGLGGLKSNMVVLVSNRHLALEKYQNEVLQATARSKSDTAFEKALRNTDKDSTYPEWSDSYLRDVVARQSHDYGVSLAQTLMATMPPLFVADATFDFGTREGSINMLAEVAKRDTPSRARLDAALAELLGNFGAHSRNALRSILKSSNQP
jgi:hypothetical protein